MARHVLSVGLLHLLALLSLRLEAVDAGAVVSFSYTNSGPSSDDSYTSALSLSPSFIYFARPMTTLFVSTNYFTFTQQ